MTSRRFFIDQKGLTLLELMMSLGISSIAIVAALSISSMATISGKQSVVRQDLSNNFGLLSAYFAREIPNGGGGGIPPEAAFLPEDDCEAKGPFPACLHSDRLTIASAVESAKCSIESFDPSTGNLVVRTVEVESVMVCCFSPSPSVSTVDLPNKQIMLIKGDFHTQRYVTGANGSSCTLQTGAGPMAAGDVATLSGVPIDFTDGFYTPLSINTYFVDHESRQFKRFRYDGASADSGIVETLVDRLLDFQFALGYDFSPADGILTENGTSNDEILYNSAGESRTDAKFTDAPSSSLRMVHVGWIMIAPGLGAKRTDAVKLLNGPERTLEGWMLQGGIAKFGIKSVNSFY